jgi:hypothetical protein
MNLDINVMTKHVPALKGAARELEIDLIVGELQGDRTIIHILIYDYYQLILLGHIAGMNSQFNNDKAIMAELVDDLNKKIEAFKPKKDQDENNSRV